MDTPLAVDTALTVLAAGLIFLWALALGVWKYHQMATSEDHLAHPYVDIAHRAALLYAFATMLLAVFVELSAWPDWVDLIAAAVVVAFFVLAIATYVVHGIRRDTTNQFERVDTTVRVAMAALIVGEIGGTAVLVAGFVAAQFF
ncbi:hypothetical protein MPRF_10180 [Mycolicibacterium parafortuitum]|uniref:Integral membrane protein n=1 Tax=Mycolicibacterium parafortuitum TaxID=39692 RepID=A0A7I7U0A1_MYCPF|nr:hypothetical protein [Mycolicibacterium parafortuitum]BBY74119.1 hypothetical protein MPRF_10180 [Mycolicibacterium parafortuitum]